MIKTNCATKMSVKLLHGTDLELGIRNDRRTKRLRCKTAPDEGRNDILSRLVRSLPEETTGATEKRGQTQRSKMKTRSSHS